MNTTDKEFLRTEPIGKLLFKLAVPAVIAQLVNLLYNMVDRIYIGQYDSSGLALTGIGLCMPVLLIVSAFAALVGFGGSPRASIYMGKQDYAAAEKILGNCFIFQIFLSIVLTIFFLLTGDRLLRLFGASSNTFSYASDYMHIYILGTIFVQLALGMNSFITAQGFSKISMISVVIGAVINIILDPIFIFGFHMGVKGAALATIIAQSCSALWVIAFLSSKKSFLQLRFSCFKIDIRLLLSCLALGIAPFIMQSTESILSICFNSSLLKYGGDTAVGAMTILTMLTQFGFLPISGITQGAQPITSYNFGAGNASRVQQSFRLLLIVSTVYAAALWLIVMIWPTAFIHLFTKDNTLVSYAVWALRIYYAGGFLFGIQCACQQTFIALGNAKTSMFLALLRKVLLLIPLIYILPIFLRNKEMAVFLAEPVADVLAVATTSILFARYFKKIINQMSKEHHT